MIKLLTTLETDDKLRVSPKTIRKWLRASKIKGNKIGRQWRIKEEVVDKIIQHGFEVNTSNLNYQSENLLPIIYDEDLPEYDWDNKKPKMKKVFYLAGKGFMVEN